MSASRCLRCILESRRSLQTAFNARPLAQSRSSSRKHNNEYPAQFQNITAGFPKLDEKGAPISEESASPETNKVLESIPDAPPKRTPPPITQSSSTATQSSPLPPPPSPPQSQSSPTSQKQAQKPTPSQSQSSISPSSTSKASDPSSSEGQPPLEKPIPLNVVAAYRTPLRHKPTHNVHVASLQLRSYSVRNLEFFSDFAMRAAYYLGLPASGPVPLPKMIERWTMPRANFVHKKSQENFERITLRRTITIYDGDKTAVEVWLAVLRKWQFYGVGMKANVWEWEGLDVAKKMDKDAASLEEEVGKKLALFGFNKKAAEERSIRELLDGQGARQAGVPLSEVRRESQHHKNVV